MSTTPKTDAVVHGNFDMGCPEFVVGAEFARDLEKEAAKVPALINALKYAEDGIAKMADLIESSESIALVVEGCRDSVSQALHDHAEGNAEAVPAFDLGPEIAALINALKYAEDGIAKMAEHCDMEAVEAMGLDVQDCRDCVGFAIERAGGVI